MWQIPLVGGQEKDVPDVAKMLALRPPPTDQITNVYNETTYPAICKYYQAAAGFPTKPTWLAAIKTDTTKHGRD